jgi:hypothetical protein
MSDEVQNFIARNSYQFGYIMGEASRRWIENDPIGALTVGPCNAFIEKYGDYHELQDKVESQQKEIEDQRKLLEWSARIIDSVMDVRQVKYNPAEWFIQYHKHKQNEINPSHGYRPTD